MSEKTIKFKNYPDFKKYLDDNNIWAFEFWVDSNPWGAGGRQKLRGVILDWGNISTCIIGQDLIDGFPYSWSDYWRTQYTGTFELVLPESNQHVKPEVYAKGDMVEILENARECGTFEDWNDEVQNMIGKTFEIASVDDGSYGVYYSVYPSGLYFPHYCVRRVEAKDETLELTLEQIAEKFGVDVDKVKIKK